MKHIRIVSDGLHMGGTRIFDADSGEEIQGLMVRKITWTHEVGELPRAILECVAVGLEGEAEAVAEIRRLDLEPPNRGAEESGA